MHMVAILLHNGYPAMFSYRQSYTLSLSVYSYLCIHYSSFYRHL